MGEKAIQILQYILAYSERLEGFVVRYFPDSENLQEAVGVFVEKDRDNSVLLTVRKRKPRRLNIKIEEPIDLFTNEPLRNLAYKEARKIAERMQRRYGVPQIEDKANLPRDAEYYRKLEIARRKDPFD